MPTDKRERPLLEPQRGAFFDAHVGPLAVSAEGGEHRDVGIDAQRIIAPLPGGDHPAIKVEDALQFHPIECRNLAPLPRSWERRDDAQALLTFGRGARSALNAAISLRNASISRSSSDSRTRIGSTSSPHGVP